MQMKYKRSDIVAKKMLEAIKEGRFELGSRLPSENVLAEEFNVSRSTLREAFKKLEQLGAIKTKHGSGSYVRNYANDYISGTNDEKQEDERIGKVISETFKLNTYQVTQYLDARSMVELTALDLAIERMDDSNYVNLKQIIDKASDQNLSPYEYIELDCRFHREIIRASKNEFIFQFWQILEPCLREQLMKLNDYPKALHYGTLTHEKIYEAMLRRDKKAAKEHLSEQLNLVLGRFFMRAKDKFIDK